MFAGFRRGRRASLLTSPPLLDGGLEDVLGGHGLDALAELLEEGLAVRAGALASGRQAIATVSHCWCGANVN